MEEIFSREKPRGKEVEIGCRTQRLIDSLVVRDGTRDNASPGCIFKRGFRDND